MIRIKLINEGKLVKQISSRLHESVVLEQLSKFEGTVDEIVYEGDLTEGAKEVLDKVAKSLGVTKLTKAAATAALAGAIAMGAPAGDAKAQNMFPGTNQSITDIVNDLFGSEARLAARQRQREREEAARQAYDQELRRAEVERARNAGRAAASGITGSGMPPGAVIYDEARFSRDGKYINLYDKDHRVTQISRERAEFVPASPRRPAHYIVGGSVYYVTHPPAGQRNESAIATVGTIPSTSSTVKTASKKTTITQNNTDDSKEDKDLIDAIKKAGIKLTQKSDQVNEIIRKVKDGYRLYSHSGRNLGTFNSRSAAEKHEREVNYFKHVSEAVEDSDLENILNKYSSSWEKFKAGGDISDNSEFYGELFDYFLNSGEMPYNVAKAQDGDPIEWITNKLDLMMNENKDDPDAPDVVATAADQEAADRNIIMQIRKAADYEKPTKIKLGDGSSVTLSPAAAQKISSMHDKVSKPDLKVAMGQMLNTQAGMKKILGHLGESMVSESESVYDAIMYRIMYRHQDLIKKHGLDRVQAAAESEADFVGDVEEIGSSDVSAWTNAVVQQLESTNEEVEQVDEMDKSGRPPGKEVSHSQYLAIKKAEDEKTKQDAAKMTPSQRERAALIKKKFGMKEATGEAYTSLNDVYPEGPTEIWYWKENNGRDFMMGYDWLAKKGVKLEPYPASLSKTHVLIGKIKETNPDKVYHMMQGEMWSPAGEARSMIKASGSGHTSMSVGDIIKIGSKYLMVDRFGFRDIENPGEPMESVQFAGTYLNPEKTAALIAHRIFSLDE